MQNVIQFPISSSSHLSAQTKGWSYLLADSLAFNKDIDFAIRIQKPDEEKMPAWIEKIITSGQCSSIYVENLALNDTDKRHIKVLCVKHKVSLFSVCVAKNVNNSVVKGPW